MIKALAQLACCIVLLEACSQKDALERFTAPEHDRVAREFLTAARSGDTVLILKAMSADGRQYAGVLDSIRAGVAFLPPGAIDTIRQIGVNRVRTSEADRSFLEYEIHTPAGWGVVDIGVTESNGTLAVDAFRTNRLAGSIESTNSFSAGARNPINLVVLLVAVACALFSIGTAITAARTSMPKRYLWAAFALIGVAPVTVNWTTGTASFQLLSVLLFSAAFLRAGFVGAWLLSVAFPIGAIATCYRIRSAKTAAIVVVPGAGEPVPMAPS